jgi:hypothetical protein
MTKAEAFVLAAQISVQVPDEDPADVLLQKCLELGYKLGLDYDNGDWVIWDEANREIARCY